MHFLPKNCGLKDNFSKKKPIKLKIFRQKLILMLLALGQKFMSLRSDQLEILISVFMPVDRPSFG